ncbi:MAG: hypothetical protein K6G22_10075 [Lachnospiraceae bacterium]|nr:hypothetical protein [Lachnospiraceae bacterium]
MKKIIVCDENAEYARRFSDYLKHRLSGTDIMLYTDIDRFLADHNGIKDDLIYIIDESFYRSLITLGIMNDDNSGNIHILSEESISSEGSFMICRYQSAKQILIKAGILSESDSWYGSELNEPAGTYVSETGAEFITVCSPAGGCLKTTFAITLSELLSQREGRKALYINLEDYSGLKDRPEFRNKKNISELIYDLRVDREGTVKRLGEYIYENDGLNMICPSVYTELEDIEGDVWLELMEILKSASIYGYFILDAGSCIHGLKKLILNSRFLFVPYRPDVISGAKLKEFSQIWESSIKETVCHCSMIPIVFPWFDGLPDELWEYKNSEIADFIRKEGLLSVI